MRRSLYVLIGGFLAGVFTRSALEVHLFTLIGFAGCGILIALLSMVRYSNPALYVVLAISAATLGVLRTELAYRGYQHDRAQVPEQYLQSSGWVDTEPDVRDGHTNITVRLEDGTGRVLPTRVRMRVPPFPVFAYGDRVLVSGELEIPEPFFGDDGREFNYPGYLMKENVHYVVKHPSVHREHGIAGSRVIRTLLAFKASWIASVSRILPEPGAAFAGGVVVGAKRSLGEYWLELFRITGLIHLVVLSGYNLTLIADVIMRIARFLPRALALTLGVTGVVSFALMVGTSATVVRATVMAVLVMLARHLGRTASISRLLAIAAFFMVLVQPFALWFDVGFQLSFLATLGLVYYAPYIERWCVWVPESFGLRSILSATCATQVAVLPLLLHVVGQLSIVAPVANILILPVIPLIMLLVFVVGLVGVVSTGLVLPLAWCAHVLLLYVFQVVDTLGTLPYAAVSLPPIPAYITIGLYVLLAWFAHHAYTNIPRKQVRAV